MEIILTAAQYAELEVLILALQNPKSQAGTVEVELEVNASKIKYSANGAVEITLS